MSTTAPPQPDATPEQAAPDRKLRRPSGAAIGAVLGGAGTLLAALFSGLALWSGGDNGTSGVAGAQSVPSPPAATAAAYRGYDRYRDDTGALSVEVPKEWGSRAGDGWHPSGFRGVRDGEWAGPGLNASPNYRQWIDSPRAEVPGVFVGASTILAEAGHTPARLAEGYLRRSDGCRFASGQAYPSAQHPDETLRGRSVRWTCGDGGSYPMWFMLAATPQGAKSPVVYVEMSLVSERDETALDRILATLDVDVAAVAARQ